MYKMSHQRHEELSTTVDCAKLVEFQTFGPFQDVFNGICKLCYLDWLTNQTKLANIICENTPKWKDFGAHRI